MKQPVLLCYNLDAGRAQGVRMAAMRCKIRVRPVAPEEYGLPVGALCGLQEGGARQEQSAAAFDDEMLVMAFFPSGLMERFLQALRRAVVPTVALKAVLTPTNAAWSSSRLRDELSREREAFGKAAAHEG